tara:strand:- start:153 stop:851 length:699 start_codon:yes stop_codon:yes gene_type:complete
MYPIIILAGGLGTRIRSSIGNIPKCLAPVGKSFFLDKLLKQLSEYEVNEVILSLGYKSEMVKSAVKNQKYIKNLSFCEEKQPLGTGGAVYNCIKNFNLEKVTVMNGDTWLDGDLSIFFNKKIKSNKDVLMGVCETDKADRFGNVSIKANRITEFKEKNCSGKGTINAGIYSFDKNILEKFHPEKRRFSIEKEIFLKYTNLLKIIPIHLNTGFIDIGVPEDYSQYLSKINGQK